MTSIRLLLQIVVQYDLLILHMDFKSAYLTMKYMLSRQKAFNVRMRILFGSFKNPDVV